MTLFTLIVLVASIFLFPALLLIYAYIEIEDIKSNVNTIDTKIPIFFFISDLLKIFYQITVPTNLIL